jgi:hypothetical protein
LSILSSSWTFLEDPVRSRKILEDLVQEFEISCRFLQVLDKIFSIYNTYIINFFMAMQLTNAPKKKFLLKLASTFMWLSCHPLQLECKSMQVRLHWLANLFCKVFSNSINHAELKNYQTSSWGTQETPPPDFPFRLASFFFPYDLTHILNK